MTEQYQQRSINEQGSVSRFVSAVGATAVTLQPGSQTVVVETTAAVATVTLPRISDCGPNCTISVVKEVAANSVTVAASVGDTLLAAATVVNPILVISGTLTFRSVLYASGATRWVAISGTV
jgi:hypothetical protein